MLEFAILTLQTCGTRPAAKLLRRFQRLAGARIWNAGTKIQAWLDGLFPGRGFTLAPASADASFRRYFRATLGRRNDAHRHGCPARKRGLPAVAASTEALPGRPEPMFRKFWRKTWNGAFLLLSGPRQCHLPAGIESRKRRLSLCGCNRLAGQDSGGKQASGASRLRPRTAEARTRSFPRMVPGKASQAGAFSCRKGVAGIRVRAHPGGEPRRAQGSSCTATTIRAT
jgi:hypothetical protein